MKIKSDFVTNSSSTAYVIVVPGNFEVTDEVINKKLDEWDIEEEEKESFITDIKKLFEFYKEGQAYDSKIKNDYDRLDSMMTDICQEKGFVIASEDVGESTPIPISYKEIIKLLLQSDNLEQLLEETLKKEK